MIEHEELRDKVRRERSEARKTLKRFKQFRLKRDVFFIHGWGDEANICWTYPYLETGEDRDKNWEYSISDWVDKLIIDKDMVHYIKLLKDESKAIIEYDKNKKLSIDIDKDESYFYTNFYQFAELLKDKVNSLRTTKEIDLVCHSMGGLDAVAAIAIDKEQDATKNIKTPYIKGVNQLITVATPHRGSPAAKLSETKLSEILFRKSAYIRKQGSEMRPNSKFMRLINSAEIRNQLLERISFLHIFGAGADIVVPKYEKSYMINLDGLRKNNFKIYPTLDLARHSQSMGITQDPRMALEILRLMRNQE